MNQKVWIITILSIFLVLFTAASVSAAINDNLTQYFSFDNTTYLWYADQTGYANLQNGNNSNASITSGKIGNAINFTGSPSYALTQLDTKILGRSKSLYNSVQKGYTIAWWSYQTTLTGTQFHMAAGTGGTTTPLLFYGNAGTSTEVDVRRGAGAPVSAAAQVAKTWYRNVVVVDITNGNYSYYRNGAFVGTASPGTANEIFTNTSFAIGSYIDGTSKMSGTIDELVMWNRTITTTEISWDYNGGSGRTFSEYNLTTTYGNASIAVTDFYTGASLSNFSVYNNATLISSTTNGTATLPYLQNTSSLFNLTIGSNTNGGYFNNTLINRNVSTVVTTSLAQSVILFTATEKVSGIIISNANFTTSYLTNTTHYMYAASYNVTTTKTGYFNSTSQISVSAFENSTRTFTNITSAQLNLTARNNITLVNIATFTAELTALNYSNYNWNESVSAASQIYLINGTYLVTVRASGYAPQSKNVTVAGGLFITNQSFELYSENSVWFNIYNATSLSLINNLTSTIQITGITTQINTTTNGTIFVSGLTPGIYNVTISATGYVTTQYVLTVGNNSFQYLNAYLESSTSNAVVFTIYDDDTSQILQNALISVEKSVNGTWYLVNSLFSDISGRISVNYEATKSYRFTVSLSGYTTKQFTLNPIIFTSYDVRLTSGTSNSLPVDFAGVSLVISPTVYYNNATNNFSITIASPSGQLQLMNYTISFSFNSTQVKKSSSNAYGATLTSSVIINNASLGDKVYLAYQYIDSVGVVHAFANSYDIQVVLTAGTFAGLGNNTFNLAAFDRIIIVIVVTLIIGGFGFTLGGLPAGGFLTVLSLAYFGAVGFVGWWFIIPSMALTLLLVIWSIA